jgi:hypothetical protein
LILHLSHMTYLGVMMFVQVVVIESTRHCGGVSCS